MSNIRVGIIGIGNCASALAQGLIHYGKQNTKRDGVINWDVGGYEPSDIEIVAAFDIDKRKVGVDLYEAIYAPPNCIEDIEKDIGLAHVQVEMGRVLDGVSNHLIDFDPLERIVISEEPDGNKKTIVKSLMDKKVEVLVNYLPVGSKLATEFYAECALEAKCAFMNCIPVFIASDKNWSARFSKAGVPIMGDDIKSQIGATILHRSISDLFRQRGGEIVRTYQTNSGGNSDFLNMKNPERLAQKKISKTEAVQSAIKSRLDTSNIHVGPSDYIPWLKDNKICNIRVEGTLFGGSNVDLDIRLSVQDSPNSAGVVVEAIRCLKLALDRGLGGVVLGPSSLYFKHPPNQVSDHEAYSMVLAFMEA